MSLKTKPKLGELLNYNEVKNAKSFEQIRVWAFTEE